jgi:alpha-glucoside transport system permease protein
MSSTVSTDAPETNPLYKPAADTMAGRVRRKLTSRTASVVSIIIAIVWTIPTFGLFVSSLRPADDIKTTGWWSFFTNPSLTLDNYNDVVFGESASSGQLASYFINSLAITLPAVLFSVSLAAMAAYALSWLNFRGRDWIFVGVFALQIVPLQMALIPLLQILGDYTEWGGGFFAVWFAHTCFGLPLGVFLLHNFMSELPKDLFEAARVDGAGPAMTFRRIVLPLITPVTVRLAELAGTRGNDWQRLTSGAFVSMVIPLIVFLSLQRYFVRGLLAGGVKG